MLLKLKLVENPPVGFIPIDDDSVKAAMKIKRDDEIFVEFKPRRNYQFHKKLFSMLNLVKNNQDRYKSVDNILNECKFKAGYFDIHISTEGKQMLIPKSIAFHSMDNDEFSEFYSSCIDTCLELVPMGREELENAVLRYC